MFSVYFLLFDLCCHYQCKWLPGKLVSALLCDEQPGRKTLLTQSVTQSINQTTQGKERGGEEKGRDVKLTLICWCTVVGSWKWWTTNCLLLSQRKVAYHRASRVRWPSHTSTASLELIDYRSSLNSAAAVRSLYVYLHRVLSTYTTWAIKTCHFISDHNSRVS